MSRLQRVRLAFPETWLQLFPESLRVGLPIEELGNEELSVVASTGQSELSRPRCPQVTKNLGRCEVSNDSRSAALIVTTKEELSRHSLMVTGVRSLSSTGFMRSSSTTSVRFTLHFCYVREIIYRQNFSQSLV